MGIHSLVLSLAGFLHSHQHSQFPAFNVLISQARDRLCFVVVVVVFLHESQPGVDCN